MFNDIINRQGWLMIIYHVPSTPSTSRVTIWKRIKELGAFLLQQSVYILPNLPSVKATVNQLKEQVIHLGGECKVIEIASLGEEQEKEVIAGFNSNREEEYSEVIKVCNEFLQEIDQESGTEDFNFAHLEENEKYMQKVRELFDNGSGLS
jgi:DNA-binding transcriptional regulator PaaX